MFFAAGTSTLAGFISLLSSVSAAFFLDEARDLVFEPSSSSSLSSLSSSGGARS